MTAQLEDQLRQEFRAMAGGEPTTTFDGRSVLSAGRAARARRRLAWVSGALAVVAVLSVFSMVLRTQDSVTPAPVPASTPEPSPTVGVGAPVQDAVDRLVRAVETQGVTVRSRWNWAVSEGYTSGRMELRHGPGPTGLSWLFVAVYRSQGPEGQFVAHCWDRDQTCAKARYSRGHGYPDWTQSIRDLPDWEHQLAGCRVLGRSFANGHLLELAACWLTGQSGHGGSQPLTDAQLTELADRTGDPWSPAR